MAKIKCVQYVGRSRNSKYSIFEQFPNAAMLCKRLLYDLEQSLNFIRCSIDTDGSDWGLIPIFNDFYYQKVILTDLTE